jgi:hypothetical protein
MGLVFNPFTGSFDFTGSGQVSNQNIVRSIGPGITDVSDSNLSSTTNGVYYTISAVTADSTKSLALICVVSNNSGTIKDQIGFKVGSLKIDVENVVTLGNHNLVIKNNETQGIIVTIKKEIY